MSFFARLKAFLLGRKPLTAGYRANPAAGSSLRVDELPPFHLGVADLMRFDPQVRIGLGARNGLLAGARAEVRGGPVEVAAWVQRQFDRIWGTSSHLLLRTKLYGFLPFEVMYRSSRSAAADSFRPGRELIEFDHLRERHPRDVRILAIDGRIAGFILRQQGRDVEVRAPKGVVCTFDAEFENPYGVSLLERAYPPWYEKWMEGGVKKTLRLRMIKDAYVGDVFWYPPDRSVQLVSGETISWQQIARDMIEARHSGGAMTLPLMYDHQGRRLVDYTPPRDIAGSSHIFQWKKDVDLEIWKALEVPPEVIEASERGSGYSGRSIPLTIALGAVQGEFAELVRCLDRDLLRPLAWLNFGREPEYEIVPAPLGVDADLTTQ